MSRIAMMYAEQILQGKKTLEDVPEKWRAEVEEILNENNKE